MADWDNHYQSRQIGEKEIAPVLAANLHLLPGKGKVLDYACGLAMNAIWFASRGYDVTALDSSLVAIEKVNQYCHQNNIKINALVRDLEVDPPVDELYDVVIVSFFLHRQTLRNIQNLIRPGGLLFYQTYSGHQVAGRGASNPAFRLQPGELLTVFSDMQILYYREDMDYGDVSKGDRGQALLVAAKSGKNVNERK
ncbi:MAG: class I SAM-dependent methyltransferase [Gammaproteobacteria bacterium]|nr:class I SAM-dependent methyltransferase [Gammaproteobacteria bacterium]